MKVVHICSSMTGGAGAAAFRLHQAILSQGVDSKMLTWNDSRESLRVYRIERPLLYRVLGKIPFIGQRRYSAFIRRYDDVMQAMTFPDAVYDCSHEAIIQSSDIVHLHWVGNMLNYRKFFTNVRKPIVWTLHDMNPFMGALHFASDMEKIAGDEHALRLERKISEKKALAYKKNPNLTIAPLCQWMKDESSASAAFSGRPHILVKNCVDVDIFNPQAKERCKLDFRLPSDKKILLYVSQHVNNPRKGFGLLSSLASFLSKECVLIVVGSGVIDGDENIINIGRVNDFSVLSSLYASADALILPSVEDNLPNTMLESLCCGTPVIAFSQGGMKDVVIDGWNGLFAESMNENSLLAAIQKFIREGVAATREEISENAVKLFSPCAVANSYIAIYESILSKL